MNDENLFPPRAAHDAPATPRAAGPGASASIADGAATLPLRAVVGVDDAAFPDIAAARPGAPGEGRVDAHASGPRSSPAAAPAALATVTAHAAQATDRLGGFARRYLLAVQFFTRIPITGALGDWVGFSPEALRSSAAHFPGVGWLVGMAACAVFAVLQLGLPGTALTPLAAAIGCTIATVLLTGGFHEDGLADLVDGLGGGQTPERTLEIMKDSRVGAFGAMALVLAIGAKVAILAVLALHSPTAVLTALLAAHALSRFWPLVVIRTLAYVGDAAGSKAKPLAERIDRGALVVGALWCLPLLGIAAAALGFGFVAGGVAASAAAAWWLRRVLVARLRGFTGDALGAVQQVSEIAFYFGAAFALGAR